ncbi:MAG: hypothetical protein HRU77_09175 [Gammaproteobacteria bacterium]|nr:MAG: hypothetical protein HRU77_09175 [Gammaproteobacteria bacterium]
MYKTRKSLLSLTALSVAMLLSGCQAVEFHKMHSGNMTPPSTHPLPPGIAKQLEQIGGDNVGFVALHDVKTGNVRLLLREDEEYRIISGREKDEILSKPRTEEKKSIIIVETFRVNPKCQLITIDGSSILMCNHIK